MQNVKSAIIIRLPIIHPFPEGMNGVFIFKHIVKEKIFSFNAIAGGGVLNDEF